MRRISLALALATAMASTAGVQQLAAQANTFSVTLKMAPNQALQIAMNGDKIGSATNSGTANNDGILNLVLVFGSQSKPQVEVQVYVGEQCTDDKTHIALVEKSADPSSIPPECKRRLLGVFWWNKATGLEITVTPGSISTIGGGLSKTTKIAIGAGAAAVAVSLAAKSGGGDTATSPAATSTTNSTTNTTPATPTTPTPAPTPTPPTVILVRDGRYTLVMKLTSTTCSPSVFVWVQSYNTVDTISGTGALFLDADSGGARNATGSIVNNTGTYSGSGSIGGFPATWIYVVGFSATAETITSLKGTFHLTTANCDGSFDASSVPVTRQ